MSYAPWIQILNNYLAQLTGPPPVPNSIVERQGLNALAHLLQFSNDEGLPLHNARERMVNQVRNAERRLGRTLAEATAIAEAIPAVVAPNAGVGEMLGGVPVEDDSDASTISEDGVGDEDSDYDGGGRDDGIPPKPKPDPIKPPPEEDWATQGTRWFHKLKDLQKRLPDPSMASFGKDEQKRRAYLLIDAVLENIAKAVRGNLENQRPVIRRQIIEIIPKLGEALEASGVMNIRFLFPDIFESQSSSNSASSNTSSSGKGKKQLKLLELFKGTGSVGKIAKRMGMTVMSVDILAKYEPDIVADVLNWDYKKFHKDTGFVPDLLWASPPCNTFSTLAYQLRERNTKTATPYSARAKQGTAILHRTLEIIHYFLKLNPSLLYCVENPRAMMRHDSEIKKVPHRDTTLYCLYNDPVRRKPTDFFNNVDLKLKSPDQPCPQYRQLVNTAKLPLNKRYAIPPKLVKTILERMVERYRK
jgi:hypothetical protein